MPREEEMEADEKPTINKRRLAIGLGLLVVLVVANVVVRAGSGPDVLPTAKIRGVVYYRGQPLNGGLVRFTSTDPNNKVGYCSGTIERDGSFQINGSPIGPVRVTVDTVNRPSEDFAPWKPNSGRPKPIFIPTHFADPNRSGLDRQIEEGENAIELRLE